ncbi:MAG: response regulator [Verrucomicrobiota bacterium]
MADDSVIAVVDDDESVRESLQGLLRSLGYPVRVFVSGEDFLAANGLDETRCLILDVRMPGMTGLELQRRLRASGAAVPIIFITAHGEEETKNQALGGGAVAFLVKPFAEDAVLSSLNLALAGR